jgi:hypothetical protein
MISVQISIDFLILLSSSLNFCERSNSLLFFWRSTLRFFWTGSFNRILFIEASSVVWSKMRDNFIILLISVVVLNKLVSWIDQWIRMILLFWVDITHGLRIFRSTSRFRLNNRSIWSCLNKWSLNALILHRARTSRSWSLSRLFVFFFNKFYIFLSRR